MGRLFRGLIYLIILGGLALAGFAYLGDLSPERGEVRMPVTLDAD